MLVVHHLENSRSHRLLWLLEELGQSYEIKHYARDPQTHRAPSALKQLHPLGKAPLLEANGKILAETGAIFGALLDELDQGDLRPTSGEALYQYRYWAHYAESTVMALLLLKLVTGQIAKAPVPFFLRPVVKSIAQRTDENFTDPELKTHLDFIEQHLSDHQWFAGDQFSAADILMSFPVWGLCSRAGAGPAMRAFLAKCEARPAYAAAIARGGDMVPLGNSA